MRGSGAEKNSADIIVVGGGGAALAAAGEAARLGARVILVEKNRLLGGSTGLAVGLMMAAGTRIQRQAGIADTPRHYDAELTRIASDQGIAGNAELRWLLARNAGDTVDFLESIGVDFIGPFEQPPFKVKRYHQALLDGRAYVHYLHRHCNALGVEIRLRTHAKRLLLTGARVTGVEVVWPHGNVAQLTARAGVILATGDFSANHELRARFVGQDPHAVGAYNPTASGDGHLMALEIGAAIARQPDLGSKIGTIAFARIAGTHSLFDLLPYSVLTPMMKFGSRILPQPWLRPFIIRAALADLPIESAFYEEGAILINRNGERFADERHVSCNDVAEQPEGQAFIAFDQRVATLFSSWPRFVSAAPGVVYAYVDDFRRARRDLYITADSVRSLAARLDVPGSRLERTIASRSASSAPLAQPPYYALGPLSAKVRHIPIGVTVNSRLQVLRPSGEAIAGLFAAGDVGQGGFAGPTHGQSLAWAMTSGRLAGRYATEELGAQDARRP
ncbi:MAG: hypothetical protein A3G25_18270 [Betaproteobacteria bacterium RIFCSPLOWO2_12_FULL_63_13]|nr:MAG: hypothetical protein A3G25_18270 [Betaproteobacteria bacterium RIFCSPLOWO2_12_FULL_63_13]